MSKPFRLSVICPKCDNKQSVELTGSNLGEMIACEACGRDLLTGDKLLKLSAEPLANLVGEGLKRRAGI
ncbi:MAG: hypothetical protein AAGI28_03590 [Pseudomonadota bacterium]